MRTTGGCRCRPNCSTNSCAPLLRKRGRRVPSRRSPPFLRQAPEASRPVLLRQLLLLDLDYRQRRGLSFSREECQRRLGGYASVIAEVLSTWLAGTETATCEAAPRPATARPDTLAADVAALRLALERLDRFVLQSQPMTGSFGIVFLATDKVLGRPVAIKLPRPDRVSRGLGTDRFLDEARRLAELSHPAIVAVHEVGTLADGWPFVVMAGIQGDSLEKYLAENPPSPAEAAALIANIADAMAHAHGRGIVHRDLKPANVIRDTDGGLHVVDFGLALEESQQRGRSGEFAGTPCCMAPEQIRGEAHRLDGRTDIWALGVMLYQMLTRRRPFDGEEQRVEQVMDEILHRDPRPPRQIKPDVPDELERICLKCLQKQITARYTTAGDLARDLRRWPRPKPPRPPIYLLVIMVAVVLGVSFSACYALFRQVGGPLLPVGPDTVRRLPQSELRGVVDVLVWDIQNPTRRGLTLREPGALPLRANDQVRVRAELSRPAYIYLLWIDAQGQAAPVYPWKPGRWDDRPPEESPLAQISLPAQLDRGWPIAGNPGMETIVLLGRDSPLPPEVDLSQLLTGFQSQPMQDESALVEFEGGQVVTETREPNRGPQFFNAEQIDDPVLRTQQWLVEKLAPYFPLIRAQSFAHRGP